MAIGDLLVPFAEVALFLEHTQAIVDKVYVLRQHALASENWNLRRRLEDRHSLANIAGSDPRMVRIFERVSDWWISMLAPPG